MVNQAKTLKSNSSMKKQSFKDDKLPSFNENLMRLRECEDFNLAMSIQEQEFNEHYNKNRSERKSISSDLRKSLADQQLAYENFLKNKAEMLRRDEEMAMEIQRQFEEEDNRARMNQAQLDEEFANRLQLKENKKNIYNTQTSSSANNINSFNKDNKLAIKLQDYYKDRFAQKPNNSIDESTPNELNTNMSVLSNQIVKMNEVDEDNLYS